MGHSGTKHKGSNEQFMSKLSSVKMESIEFAKRHFNGSSNEEREDGEEEAAMIHEYEDAENSSDKEKAFSEYVKTDLSFENDLACFPIN